MRPGARLRLPRPAHTSLAPYYPLICVVVLLNGEALNRDE